MASQGGLSRDTQAGVSAQPPEVPSGAALPMLGPNVRGAARWQVPAALCDIAPHHSGTPASQRQLPLPTVPAATLPGKAWATPGLLSPALCSAGGGEGRPRESTGDAAWGSGEEEEEEKEKERSRGVL